MKPLGAPRTRIAWAAFAALAYPAMGIAAEPKELNLEGRWRQGALKEEATVREWLTACGPAPVSRVVAGGDIVDVSRDLDELSLSGGSGAPPFNTRNCYEAIPALANDTHSYDTKTRTWRTRCATPEGDPRRIVVQTSLTVESEKHLSLAETVHYEVAVSEGKCLADVKRTRAFELVSHDLPTAAPTDHTIPARSPTAETRRLTFAIVVASATAVLAAIWAAIAYAQRRTARRKAEIEAEAQRARDEKQRAKEAARAAERASRPKRNTPLKPVVFHDGPLMCPTCQREFDSPISFCPYDGNRLAPLNETRKSAPPGNVCPACHRGYNPGTKSCPHDGEELIPYLRGVSEVSGEDSSGAICPTCSSKSEGRGAFCVRDGTPLSPLN